MFDAENRPVSNPAFLQSGYLLATVGMIYQDAYIVEDSTTRYALAGTGGLPEGQNSIQA